jgi:uncharacterized protein YceK
MSMRCHILLPLLLWALVSGPGCGTFSQLTSGKGLAIYGGLRVDCSLVGQGWDLIQPSMSESGGWAAREKPPMAVLWPVMLLDVPFSLAADTILLPFSLLNELCQGGIDVDGI